MTRLLYFVPHTPALTPAPHPCVRACTNTHCEITHGTRRARAPTVKLTPGITIGRRTAPWSANVWQVRPARRGRKRIFLRSESEPRCQKDFTLRAKALAREKRSG